MITRHILTFLSALIVLTTGCTPAKSISLAVPEPTYWPTEGWKSSTPEAQGMDSELLFQMLEEISANNTRIHSVLIIRNGYMVTEAYFHPYTRDTKIDIQSVTKSVIDILVGKAIEDGYIKDANEKLLDFYPAREFSNPDQRKNSIRLKHLLSMSSGLNCAGPSASVAIMEQSSQWVQFMLDLPMIDAPGKHFGYCNGNSHLLSAVLEEATGMSAREYANQILFSPLGIPSVDEIGWGSDPQNITLGGFGLHLTPKDMAKLGFLYLHNGEWDGKQIVPAKWVADSTREYVQKEDGSGYGYLWTVYSQDGHYAALGRAGQQIHVYPSKNLVVVVTAEFEINTEAPEIEGLLKAFILPSIQSEAPLADNPEAVARLQAAVEMAANPIQPVPELPAIAREISGKTYTLEENPNGWQSLVLFFEPGASTAQASTTGYDTLDEIGLDNIFRPATLPGNPIMMRGRWMNDQIFMVEWTLPGELATAEIQAEFIGDSVEITIRQLVFGGEPLVIKGTRSSKIQ